MIAPVGGSRSDRPVLLASGYRRGHVKLDRHGYPPLVAGGQGRTSAKVTETAYALAILTAGAVIGFGVALIWGFGA